MAKWFHTRIHEARERAGLSQAELADKFKISGATISNWENRVSEPREDQREKVLEWVEKIEKSHRRRSSERSAEDEGAVEDDGALRALEAIYEFWPQSRIAEALSVSQASVSNWLRTGNVPAKYADTLKPLVAELTKETAEKREPRAEDPHLEETVYADWLRSALEQQSLNAVELAQRSGVHVNTVLALLEGRTEKPQERTRQRLEKALRATGVSESVAASEQDPWYYIGLDWTAEEIDQVPDEPGVYMIHDRLGRPAYVGVAHKGAGGIRARLKKHNELRWTSDRKVASRFSYALTSRMPREDASQLAKSVEKLLIKFMGNAILINEHGVEDIAG